MLTIMLDVYPMKGEKKKMEKPKANASKSKAKECQYCKKSMKKKSDFETWIIQKKTKEKMWGSSQWSGSNSHMEMKGSPTSENEKIWANVFKRKKLNLT